MGVSGGEEGARYGPSMMPGGNPKAWPHIKPIFQSICAKSDNGEPCCDWVGDGGSGHYVKMVHNGIEYGDMQLISEAAAICRELGGLGASEVASLFSRLNDGPLAGFLMETTADVFRKLDTEDASKAL